MAASLIQCAQVKQRKSLLASPCPVEYSPTERNEAHRSLKQPLQLTVSNFKKREAGAYTTKALFYRTVKVKTILQEARGDFYGAGL